MSLTFEENKLFPTKGATLLPTVLVSHLIVLVNEGHGAEVGAVRVGGMVWEVLLALVGVVGVVGVVGLVVWVWRAGVLHALLELQPL